MKEVENKFIVINIKDLEHLTEEGKEKLYTIIYAIEKARKMHNKKINNYWVCNQDEPYAEQVKNLILSDGEASQLEPPVKPEIAEDSPEVIWGEPLRKKKGFTLDDFSDCKLPKLPDDCDATESDIY